MTAVSDAQTVTKLRLVRSPTAPALARHHIENELVVPLPAGRLHDLVLLTSEVVTNAVEHSSADAIEISVVGGPASTRIEIRNSGEGWDSRPEPRSSEPDAAGGWGLFLVEQLSDRWGIRDSDHTVWFEFDHPEQTPTEEIGGLLGRVAYPVTGQDLVDAGVTGGLTFAAVARLQSLDKREYVDADAVARAVFGRRAESNPSVVAITAEACERCGFPRTAGESHSCIEEKALFAESVNTVSPADG